MRLGYTAQEARSAEVVKEFLGVEFTDAGEVEGLPSNSDVVAAVELLNNARARREAIRCLDAGDFVEARDVMFACMASTKAARDIDPESLALLEEEKDLESLAQVLGDASAMKSNRKNLRYNATRASETSSGVDLYVVPPSRRNLGIENVGVKDSA